MRHAPLLRRYHRTSRPNRSVIALIVLAVVSTFLWIGAAPATAAGDGVLDVAISPIDASDNSTITEIADTQHNNRITYEVQYSCGVAACEGAEVQLSPSQPDPYGVLPSGRTLLLYEDWTPPAAGGTISGDNVTGKKIELGDLAPGDAGTFRVTYRIERQTSGTTNDAGRDVPNGAFYPDGFQIKMSAAISSETAVAPVTGHASDVTWHIRVPNGPSTAIGSPASIKPGDDIIQQLVMNPGNMTTGPGANITGSATVNAVGNYEVVYHAPPQATIVEAPLGGVIDPVANTVTWTMGSQANPVYGARGGWGLNQATGFNGYGNAPRNGADPSTQAVWGARNVKLNFDGTKFPDADVNGCNFAAEVTSTIDVSVTYLDGARTTKTVSNSRNAEVACWDPFGGVFAEKRLPASQTSRLDGGISNSPYWVSALNVPGPGQPDRVGPYWQIAVSNRGNVPGIAVIEDNAISHDHIKVDRIRPTGVGMSIEWVAANGDTGTTAVAVNTDLTAPAGSWFTSVKATTQDIAPGRIQPTDNTESWAYLNMYFRTDSGASAKLGEQRLNTATVEMTYPNFGGAGEPPIYEPWTDITDRDLLAEPLTATLQHAVQYTRATPALVAAFTGAPVVDGGGNPAPGTEVTYEMRGQTSSVWPGTQILPQLIFLAPVGWNVVPGSAEMSADAPAGVTLQYATRTVGGQQRDVVIATWPAAITPSSTGAENWPTLTAKAVPGPTAPTGTNAGVAHVWAGDASGTWYDAVGGAYITNENQFRASSPVADTTDIDADLNMGEEFATAASGALTVTASTLLSVVKEICISDPSAADGCDWTSDTASAHPIPVNTDDVKYRITVRNAGNTTVNDVVAYDVLPYVGDTGLLASSSARGSQFDMTIDSVESASSGTTLAFSASTNPARPEVNPGAAGTTNDWDATAAGKKALRITVDSAMAPGDAKSVVLVAAVGSGAAADQQACNSVAYDSGQTLPAEPRAVCLTLAEADLRIVLGDISDLYPNTSRTLDYTVTNLGGSDNAPGTATVDIPAGVTVTDLDVPGWTCEVAGGGSAPVAGAATLECSPVDGDGDPRELGINAPSGLSLPIDVGAVTGDELCFPASVTGPLYDPVLLNNTTTGCRAVATPDMPVLRVVKSSELTQDAITPDEADEGDQITYTFTVHNDGPGIAHDVSINDDLDGLSAVSPASVATIAVGGSAQFTATYTVTEDDAEAGSVENSATATFTPPTPPGGTTPPEVTTPPSNLVEVPVVIAEPELEVTKSVDPETGTTIATGDVLTYTLRFENTGYVPAPVDYTDDLSDVIDDADVTVAPQPTNGLLTVTPNADGTDITGTLQVGEVETITYTVQVRPRAERDNDTLANFLLTGNQQPPANGACDPAGSIPCTANPVSGDIDVVKSVDADGEVEDGQTVTYKLIVTNTGVHAGTVDLVDHLGNVLDDASFGKIVSAGGLTVERDGDLLRITGTLDGGESTAVVYTVKADSDADGDGMLLNAVAGNGVDVDLSACDDDDAQCTLTPVAPPASALPDTGAPFGLGGLLGALGLLVAGAAMIVTARAGNGRHRATI